MIKEAYPIVNFEKEDKGSQILKNLILHRKVCNHPLFVMDLLCKKLPSKDLISHSAKLLGLIDLLKQCEMLSSQE